MNDYSLPWDDLPTAKLRLPKPSPAPDSETPAKYSRLQKAAATKMLRKEKAAVRIAYRETGSDWRWWHLVVHGPSDDVAAFAAVARGPGMIPWRFDGKMLEEDLLAYLYGGDDAPSLSVSECRILTRHFCRAVETRQSRTDTTIRPAILCPLDLHVLLPVPPAILGLGAAHPDADAWLLKHWGVLDQPRQVTVLEGRTAGRRLPQGHVPLVYGFFTEGPAPEAARTALQARWPKLVCRLDRQSLT